MKRNFTIGVRMFVYSPDYSQRVKMSIPPFTANKIDWYNDEDFARELAKELGKHLTATLVKLARKNLTYRWGIFIGKLIDFDI